MDIGSHVEVVLNNTNGVCVSCAVVERKADYLVCLTASTDEPVVLSSVELTIDNADVMFDGVQSFEFVADPTVDSVEPTKTIVRYQMMTRY